MTKAIYFGDPIGDLEEERERILLELAEHGIGMRIEIADKPPFYGRRFDILFFDWGGISSMGASGSMHGFCRDILDCADANPGRIFVMVSTFTKMAMEDALRELPVCPDNVYLDIDSAILALSVFSDQEPYEPPGVHGELKSPPRLS